MFHILDDEPELLDILQDIVESAGYGVMRFGSSEAYLKYFDSTAFVAPTAIGSDYQMGGISGLELIAKVREKIPFLKAAIISGRPSPELGKLRHKCLCHFLPKPYQFDKVYALLDAFDKCHHDWQSSDAALSNSCRHGLEHSCPFHPDSSVIE